MYTDSNFVVAGVH